MCGPYNRSFKPINQLNKYRNFWLQEKLPNWPNCSNFKFLAILFNSDNRPIHFRVVSISNVVPSALPVICRNSGGHPTPPPTQKLGEFFFAVNCLFLLFLFFQFILSPFHPISGFFVTPTTKGKVKKPSLHCSHKFFYWFNFLMLLQLI